MTLAERSIALCVQKFSLNTSGSVYCVLACACVYLHYDKYYAYSFLDVNHFSIFFFSPNLATALTPSESDSTSLSKALL